VVAGFSLGDFVLYAWVSNVRNKLQAKKLRHAQVMEVVFDWMYAVEDLTTKKARVVHANRLECYADSQLHGSI
jgi:hypothetical protein